MPSITAQISTVVSSSVPLPHCPEHQERPRGDEGGLLMLRLLLIREIHGQVVSTPGELVNEHVVWRCMVLPSYGSIRAALAGITSCVIRPGCQRHERIRFGRQGDTYESV